MKQEVASGHFLSRGKMSMSILQREICEQMAGYIMSEDATFLFLKKKKTLSVEIFPFFFFLQNQAENRRKALPPPLKIQKSKYWSGEKKTYWVVMLLAVRLQWVRPEVFPQDAYRWKMVDFFVKGHLIWGDKNDLRGGDQSQSCCLCFPLPCRTCSFFFPV